MDRHGHSEACCTVPPAKHDYTETGSFEEIGGLKTYKTGPSNATTAILIVYDIFGFSKQALQGADFLAHADDEHHQYQVYMPDFLQGEYAQLSWYPPDTDEKKQKMGALFGGPAAPAKSVEAAPKWLEAVKQTSAGANVKQWGCVGMCWGGKVVTLLSGEGTPFTAVAKVHPAMVDPSEATKITIPMCVLASGDEDAEAIKGFGENLKGKKHVETFKDQTHGWMAARADLQDKRIKEEYERGYQVLLNFFHEHL